MSAHKEIRFWGLGFRLYGSWYRVGGGVGNSGLIPPRFRPSQGPCRVAPQGGKRQSAKPNLLNCLVNPQKNLEAGLGAIRAGTPYTLLLRIP